MWKKKVRVLIKKTLDENKDLSLRSVAKKANVSPGALSEIIHGKRSVSERSAYQILDALQIDFQEKEELKTLIKREVNGKRALLGHEAEVLISHWFFSSILCLFETTNPPKSREGIATRLGISIEKARWATDILIKHGMLKDGKEEGLELTGSYWTTTDEVSSDTIKKAHLNEFKLAEKAITHVPIGERDFTSITFAGNSKQVDQVKKEIRRFRDRISQILSEGDSDQVYKMNLQFFPLDHWRLGESE